MGKTGFSSAPANGVANASVSASVGGAQVLELAPDNKLTSAQLRMGGALQVDSGLFALELSPPFGRRRIVDFLVPGDIFPTAAANDQSWCSMRAVAPSVVRLYEISSQQDYNSDVLQAALWDHLTAHIARRNLHQVIIDQGDCEARVASFLMLATLRCCGKLADKQLLTWQLSPSDMADYLAISTDSLLRVMSSLEKAGTVQRRDRTTIEIREAERLAIRSPIRRQLMSLFSNRCNRPSTTALN